MYITGQIKHYFTENVKVLQEYLNDKIVFKTLLFKSIYKPEDDPRRRIPIREKVNWNSKLTWGIGMGIFWKIGGPCTTVEA